MANRLLATKTVLKPWGKEIWFAQTDNYMGKILIIDPNQRVSRHYHEIKEETLYVWEGEVKVDRRPRGSKTGSGRWVKPGGKFHFKAGDVHTMQAALTKRVVLFEVSTPFPEDSIRVQDFYGRPCKTQ